jgi:hypothetical protein
LTILADQTAFAPAKTIFADGQERFLSMKIIPVILWRQPLVSSRSTRFLLHKKLRAGLYALAVGTGLCYIVCTLSACRKIAVGREGWMKVGVLGSGDVGKVLASGFLKHGHEVMLGSRNPGKLSDWLARNSGGSAGSFAEAAAFGETVVLAVGGKVAAEALRLAGPRNLTGKTIVDATNPIEEAPPVNGVLRFFTSLDQSLMEQLQSEFGEARFVKAFNSVGNNLMINPQFEGGKPTMFICGNDAAAKRSVSGILDRFGWEVADMGSAEAARAIEPLCMLWCIPGFLRNEWGHAFKLLRK